MLPPNAPRASGALSRGFTILEAPAAARVGSLLADEGETAAPTRSRAPAAILAITLAAALHAAPATGFLAAPASVPQAQPSPAREEFMMRSQLKYGAMAGAVALSLASVALGQEAVQWGWNGHWYRLVTRPASCDWPTARLECEAQGGHLVSMTNAAEAQFVASIARVPAAYDYFVGPWLGGYQDTGAPDYSEPAGGWRWVTGEQWYSEWVGDEPNNGGTQVENYLMLAGAPPTYINLNWNDFGPHYSIQPKSYIIEWSADCNGDGIVDYGQIRAGDLVDLNANNIPDCCESALGCCPGDIVDDGVVNGVDLAAVLSNWGTSGGKLGADVNGDGSVNGQDLAIVLSGWGSCG